MALVALGVGSSSAIGSVLQGPLFAPTPFADAEGLVRVWGGVEQTLVQDRSLVASEVALLREGVSDLMTLGAFQGRSAIVEIRAAAEQSTVAAIEPEVFRLLGAPLSEGRLPGLDEARAGLCLVSERLWRRLDRVGRRLSIEGTEYVAIGAVDSGFTFPTSGTEVWTFVELASHADEQRTEQWTDSWAVVGRRQRGVSFEQLNARLAEVMRAGRPVGSRRIAWAQDYVQSVRQPLRSILKSLMATQTLLLALLGSALFILGLAVDARRQREQTIRRALGASRSALFRESTVRVLPFASLGLLAAWPFAQWLLTVFRQADLVSDGGLSSPSPAAFLSSVVAVSGFAALQLWLRLPSPGSVPGLTGVPRLTLWRRLSVLQLMLVLLAVWGTLFFGQRAHDLARVDVGFAGEDLLVTELRLPLEEFPVDLDDSSTWSPNHVVVSDLLERIRAEPGLQESALGMVYPLTPGWTAPVSVSGRPSQDLRMRPVSDAYFATAGIELLQGREFVPSDRLGTPSVAVINQAAARVLYGSDDPIGKTLRIWGVDRKVVGLARDVHFLGLDRPSPASVYTPYFQTPTAFFFVESRTKLTSEQVGQQLDRLASQVHPAISVLRPFPAAAELEVPLRRSSGAAVLSRAASLSVALLSVLGVFGLSLVSLDSWAHESAVRRALGSSMLRFCSLAARRLVAPGLSALAAGGAVLAAVLVSASPPRGDVLTALAQALVSTSALLVLSVGLPLLRFANAESEALRSRLERSV
ncbi:MAG: ABC transporter permease [Acidobacteriota bacterium]